MSTHDDSDLRALLHETADQITPYGSLEEITARTASRRIRILPILAAAAAAVLVLGGVGWMLRDDSSPSRHDGPSSTGSPAPTSKTVAVYYVGDTPAGPRLFAEQTKLSSPDGNLSGFGMQAAKDAVSGTPKDPDYRSPWPAGTTIQGLGGCEGACDIQVTFAGTSVRDRPAGMSEELARLAIDQLVRSVQAAMGYDDPVTFASFTASDNKTEFLDQVLGVETRGSTPAGSDSDLAPVQITNVTNGEKMNTGPVSVTGLAATFEANVVWKVLVGGDAVVDQGFTTAKECCTLSPYSFTTKGLAPGTYTIVVQDTDESGSGRPVNQDTKEIIVQ
jgi:hypothetical protein